MASPLASKFTVNDLRAARSTGKKIPMLTCYDYSTARLMHEVGVPILLVGDSAGTVILGYASTLPTPLNFMIEITAAVRRGAPNALLVADMPFGSYQASVAQGVRNVARMVKQTGCDCVKLEVAASHAKLVCALADAGVAVMAHLGLRPQTVGLLGGYRSQGRTAQQARRIVALARTMQDSGAAALLLETVPPEVSQAVVAATEIAVIGCGAGPACHGSVIVTPDALGLTTAHPRFVPMLQNISEPMKTAFADYMMRVTTGAYPATEHQYEMLPEEKAKFLSEGHSKTSSTD